MDSEERQVHVLQNKELTRLENMITKLESGLENWGNKLEDKIDNLTKNLLANYATSDRVEKMVQDKVQSAIALLQAEQRGSEKGVQGWQAIIGAIVLAGVTALITRAAG